MEENAFKFPTETIELPSKGLIYPEDNPLSSGVIEMKYMTAKEEDILSNQSYINNGTVIDKLLRSLIVTKCNYSDLIVGDKNAVMIAARILGYGKDYKFQYKGEEVEVDLSTLENKELMKVLLLKDKMNLNLHYLIQVQKFHINFYLIKMKWLLKLNLKV